MSVNVLSPPNDSVVAFDHFSCFSDWSSSFLFSSYSITNISLLVPLSVLILYLGVQRRHSNSSARHLDCFTYHMVAMEMLGVTGSVLICCGTFMDRRDILRVGFFADALPWYGHGFLNILTCVEFYLAAVHPVTYQTLKGLKGVRLRNMSLGFVWLISLGLVCIIELEKVVLILDFVVCVISLVIISFCGVSVLCALIRPGPGEQGGGRKKVDQSKLRAFYTIMAILVVLLLNFVWNIFGSFGSIWPREQGCVMFGVSAWFRLPSNLVLPLLFLHRAGMFAWICS
ncbi:uncharacterized protein V6R79_011930 [Siganus canaliculatus]